MRQPTPVALTAEMPFNIIYLSGIDWHAHGASCRAMACYATVARAQAMGYGRRRGDAASTPLYLNTTCQLLPTLVWRQWLC